MHAPQIRTQSRIARHLISAAALAALSTQPAFARQSEQEISIASSAPGVQLGGTLTLPAGEGPHAAALIIAASGAHPRHEARTGGRHWEQLAARLANEGIATLALDNRTSGASTVEGVTEWTYEWTNSDYLADSTAALDWLRAQPQIDSSRIGLIGHSDGAWRAALLTGQRADDIAFLVVLSPGGQSGADNMISTQLAALGDPETSPALEARASLRRTLDLIIAGDNREAAVASAAETLAFLGIPEEQRAAAAERTVTNLSPAGFREVLASNPDAAFRQVSCPTLALFGAADNRQPAHINMPRVSAAAIESGALYQSQVFPGLGHFLEPAPLAEGATPVFAPEVVEAITEWAGPFAKPSLAGALRPLQPLLGQWIVTSERTFNSTGALIEEESGGIVDVRASLRGTLIELRTMPHEPSPDSESLLWILADDGKGGIESFHKTSEYRGDLRASGSWKNDTFELIVPGPNGKPRDRAEIRFPSPDSVSMTVFRRSGSKWFIRSEQSWSRQLGAIASAD